MGVLRSKPQAKGGRIYRRELDRISSYPLLFIHTLEIDESNHFSPIQFYSILFSSIVFHSIMFYSAVFVSVYFFRSFYAMPCPSIEFLFYSVLDCSNLFISILFSLIRFFSFSLSRAVLSVCKRFHRLLSSEQ